MAKITSKQLRVIVDANTLMRGVIHPRFAFEILNHAFKDDFKLLLIPYTIEEAIRSTAKYFPNRLKSLELFLTKCPYTLLKDPSLADLKKHHNLVRDKTDLPLVVAAIKAKVDYLISNDKDFVGDDTTTSKIQSQIHCLTAGNFLRKVLGWTSEELATIQRRKWDDFAYVCLFLNFLFFWFIRLMSRSQFTKI